jgi:hypothetical protein
MCDCVYECVCGCVTDYVWLCKSQTGEGQDRLGKESQTAEAKPNNPTKTQP